MLSVQLTIASLGILILIRNYIVYRVAIKAIDVVHNYNMHQLYLESQGMIPSPAKLIRDCEASSVWQLFQITKWRFGDFYPELVGLDKSEYRDSAEKLRKLYNL